MKKIIPQILIIFVFWSTTYSQENKLNPNLLTFPVSPEAAKLGTFGEIPVNLFYGRLEKNIELFTGNVGDFNLPIQLSYNYAGNRLEDLPSIIGLGWQLSLGGVVSREVKGLPDEHPRGFNNATVKEIVNNYIATSNSTNTNTNTISITDHYADLLASGFLDGEADKYNVSVNGIHFSFKIGVDGTPAFLSKHDYKLQILREPDNPGSTQIINGFILIDPNANQYFFEQKEINEPFLGYSSFFEEGFPAYTSSWQLSKIIVNNGEEIKFTYDDNDFKTYNFYASLQIRHRDPPAADVDSQGCTNDNIKRKILKSITSKNFKIKFDYIKLNNYEVYNKMIVKDMNDKIVNSYNFSYSGNRNFLDNITKNNTTFYGFEYNDAGGQFINSIYAYPNSVDYWGFSNGSNNWTPFLVEGTSYRADKEPNFGETVKGSLKTIHYPTGGRTEITYEQNLSTTSITEKNEPNVGIQLNFKSDFLTDASPSKESTFTKTFDTDVVATLSHYIGDVNFIDMSIKRIAGEFPAGNDTTSPYYFLVPLTRTQDGIDIPRVSLQLSELSQIDSNCLGFNNCAVTKNSSGKFIIPAGTYEFKIRTDYNRIQNLEAAINLSFYDAAVAEHTRGEVTIPVGGIRVGSTTDYPTIGDPVTKYYDYTDATGLCSGFQFNGNVKLYRTHSSKETLLSKGPFQLPYAEIPQHENVLNASSRPYNLGINNNSPVGYLSVKECTIRNEIIKKERFLCTNCGGQFSGGNNSVSYFYIPGEYGVKKNIYPEGYKMTQFTSPPTSPATFPTQIVGQDLSIGTEKSKLIYSSNNSNTNNKKLFEETNLYFSTGDLEYMPTTVTNNPNYPKSLKVDYKVVRSYLQEISPVNTVKDFYYFNVYKEFDTEKFIYNKKTTEYYNDQPLDKTVEIQYNSHYKQKKITTTFDADNIITNEIFYPYDFTDRNSQEMVNKNFISPVVQIINKKNGEIIDSYKYEFTSVSGGNLFKPKLFYKSKNNNSLEKRNTYDYDSAGNVNYLGSITTDNPVPRNMIVDSNTKIIWGYNKSNIVAKVESTSLITIPPNLITAIENASSITGDEPSLLSSLTALRNDSSMINCMVTTFTYLPLVGVSTITDPKGMITFYQYDKMNRLKFVKDKDLNVLQKYCYNYKGQQTDCSDNTSSSTIFYKSVARSDYFTRDNCQFLGVGSTVNYIQDAGEVTSTISQADADALGLAKFNSDGKVYANTIGFCTFSSVAQSGAFTKNNCAVGGVGSSVAFSQVAGAQTSTISQADADSKGLTLFNTNGQANANSDGTCIFSSIAQSGSFIKNNCADGGLGSSVVFSQATGAQTSTISQGDADSKGFALFNTNGQANANNYGICTFNSIAQNGSFTKNNCAEGGVGSSVAFSQAAGAQTSMISQADADSKGLALFKTNGRANANNYGICTFNSIAQNGSFTKNNCAEGGVGSSVAFSQAAGAQTSTISQGDADSKGLALLNSNGQANANNNGTCTFSSITQSGSFTKNNCASGGTGSLVTYTVAVGKYFSTISQEDADAKAQNDINANGQNYANSNGYCTFSNTTRSGVFVKNNCDPGGAGSALTYTVLAGIYFSNISQSDADAQADANVAANGQNYANANGYCTFSNVTITQLYIRNNCDSGGVPSSLYYSIAAGTFTSTISQTDADSKAIQRCDIFGQTHANNQGTCTFSSIPQSGWFTKDNCAPGGVGSNIAFSQGVGAQNSTISQADADSKGLALFNINGQANANVDGNCTFTNIAKRGAFTKNNCAAGGAGSVVVYTVPAGRYYSTDSQAAADTSAQTDVNNNGQDNANAYGYCTFSNEAITNSYTKNDCPSGSVGSSLNYTVQAGQYTSTNSQWEADYFATKRCDIFGQMNANNNGTCTFYNTPKSEVFVKNNCGSGFGSAVTYTVLSGVYSSTLSQADADNKAQNDVIFNGQNYANANGTCGFYNTQKRRDFNRNNCGIGYIGSIVTYVVDQGKYFSTTQKSADLAALSDLNANGQNYANTNGTCTYDNH